MLHDDDHRALGHRLGLFHIQEEAAGSVFWHPRGLELVRALEDHIRRIVQGQGYREVRSPQVLAQSIWERSGHWSVFRQGMLVVEGEARALKPVSCPGHIELVRRMAPLSSELPLRLSEFGLVHRDEPSGALHGLFRLRQFVQDDGHVFCREDQVAAELALFVRSLRALYSSLGFDDVQVAFSGRPAHRLGDDGVWHRAEALLSEAARARGTRMERATRRRGLLRAEARVRAPRPARAGVAVRDDPGRPRAARPLRARPPGRRWRAAPAGRPPPRAPWQPGAFPRHPPRAPPRPAPGLARTGAGGGGERRAGSAYARAAFRALQEAGVRARLDDREEALSRKVADAHRLAIPYLVAAGPRDEARASVRIRDRENQQRDVHLDALGPELARACAPLPPRSRMMPSATARPGTRGGPTSPVRSGRSGNGRRRRQ